MAVFDSKQFNPEVFAGYIDRIPNPKKNELIKSRAIRMRNDLAASMADQTGGNYITTLLTGLINGTAPVNYDGTTDIDADTTRTFSHSRIVVGRAKAWVEKDFASDITGGEDFMANVAAQVAEYWDEVDQDTLVHILNGIFHMSDEKGLEFVQAHTYNVSEKTNSNGELGKADGTTFNTAMQKACGDNKGKFSMSIMHSAVATNMENLKLLVYLKYNDADGIERDLSIGTLNGKLCLVDDSMPTSTVVATPETKGVYTITVSTAAVAGDTITVGGVSYTFGAKTDLRSKTLAVGSSASDQAVEIVKALARQYDGMFVVTANGAKVVLTQLVGGTGAMPTVAKTGTLAATIAQTTAGVAKVETTTYTSYVLGDGAVEYTNCGAKTPYEMDRDPKVNGGQDTLYSRQRKSFAPYGISFTKKDMAKLSPTDDELELGTNWELVNSNEAGTKEYIAHKTIPIARVISLG